MKPRGRALKSLKRTKPFGTSHRLAQNFPSSSNLLSWGWETLTSEIQSSRPNTVSPRVCFQYIISNLGLIRWNFNIWTAKSYLHPKENTGGYEIVQVLTSFISLSLWIWSDSSFLENCWLRPFRWYCHRKEVSAHQGSPQLLKKLQTGWPAEAHEHVLQASLSAHLMRGGIRFCEK